MKLQKRIKILLQLKTYLDENNQEWQDVKTRASQANGWFIPEFIELAVKNISEKFLKADLLRSWVEHYHIDDNITQKNIGVVMAGNIPLVGFHDFLCVFVAGHQQTIKLSSKDEELLKHLVLKMTEWDQEIQHYVSFAPMLKGCDAYIATGSNNSAVYFDFYFSKYPSIIRRNRSSIAVLTGNESTEQLEKLADDIHVYFGLGCRNVTKIFVPANYDFVPLLKSFHSYQYFSDHHKYRNNYDYNLSLLIMNNRYYMTNEATLLVENESIFSPISQLNYGFYTDLDQLNVSLNDNKDIQCIVGKDIDFGMAQVPALMDYADGIDTMQFLLTV